VLARFADPAGGTHPFVGAVRMQRNFKPIGKVWQALADRKPEHLAAEFMMCTSSGEKVGQAVYLWPMTVHGKSLQPTAFTFAGEVFLRVDEISGGKCCRMHR